MKNIFTIFILIIIFSTTITGKTNIVRIDTTEEQLIYPGKILEGPDKNIYIYDSQDAFIKVFSPEGKLIRKIWGKGEGPGQVKRADGLDFNFTPDRKQLYFTEYFMGHRWITFTDREGLLKSTLEYKLNGFYGIAGAIIHDSDTIYLRIDRTGKTDRKRDVYYSYYLSEIVIINKSGNKTTSVLKREHPERISFIKDGGDMGIPFTPGFMWAVSGSGEVIFTDGTGNELEIYNKEGMLLRKVVVPVPEAEKVKQIDLSLWRNNLMELYRNKNKSWYKRFGSVIEKYTKSIFKFKPVILRMSLTPAGNIFLKCRTSKKDQFKYVLTNINGEMINESDSELRKIQISKNYIFFLRISEDEEEEISFLNRSGKEKEDLIKLFLSAD